MTDAMALLEAVDQVAQEGEPNPQLYQMLVGALRTLDAARLGAARRRLLLEAAGPRGRHAAARRLRALRRRRATWWPSTPPRAARCAGPAGGARR